MSRETAGTYVEVVVGDFVFELGSHCECEPGDVRSSLVVLFAKMSLSLSIVKKTAAIESRKGSYGVKRVDEWGTAPEQARH